MSATTDVTDPATSMTWDTAGDTRRGLEQGSGWIFQVFAATVIGGVSLNGGKGSVFGALTGLLTLQLVVNVMTLAGVPPLWNQFLNDAIIIVALIISRFASGEKQE